MQSQFNHDDVHAHEPLLVYEVLHNLVLEMTRMGIEVKNLKMRVESVPAGSSSTSGAPRAGSGRASRSEGPRTRRSARQPRQPAHGRVGAAAPAAAGAP